MTEHCVRCGRAAPPPIAGPEGAVEQGWATYTSEEELIIDIPWQTEFILPPDVAQAIGTHEGLVRLVPLGPEITVAAVREITTQCYGVACPDCQAQTGWDWFEWVVFMSGLTDQGGEGV